VLRHPHSSRAQPTRKVSEEEYEVYFMSETAGYMIYNHKRNDEIVTQLRISQITTEEVWENMLKANSIKK
jgi:hypothetical protein